ncbi:hypothetical protein RI129_003428 [Pyrocoelia pectoralis]|uniref:Amidase domain-containing protein n=1 Tax=Pyrocoelia pectoralis TaxID=417401 RepID=A0AAN7VP81_9COLE
MITFFIKILFFSVPKPTNLLVLQSATSLAKKIRKQKISSEETVLAFIDRIGQVNPLINAIVDSRFEAALEEAKIVDELIKNRKITKEEFEAKPFLGVPFTSMESIGCRGMKNSFGLLCRKQKRAVQDADVIRLLKSAGGILIGVTNIPILNMWQETSNPVYGRSNNPYNCTRTTGGSSGGEAAIIAACGVPFGICTDFGGSVRISAFACGIFGHKPTSDLVSTKGVIYRTGREITIMTVGILSRTSYDIIPLLNVLIDKNVSKLRLDEKVNVCDLQIYYMVKCEDPKMDQLSYEMEDTILRVVQYFKLNSKLVPQELTLSNIRYSCNLWNFWIKQETNANFAQDLTDRKREVKPVIEILKFLTLFSQYNIGAIFALINYMLPLQDHKWACDLTKQLTDLLIATLGDKGVLLYPTAPWTAKYHNASIFHPYNFGYCSVWNALNFPVTQVPLGLDSEGLPIGIQVVAAPFQDHLCINVAKELEEAFGGYVPPFKS